MDRKKTSAIAILGILVMASIAVMPSVAATSYDRPAAISYAHTFCYDRNPDFRDFGNLDCTNFVSQCVLAGNWPMTGWYKFSKSHWFYNGGGYWDYSNTWTVADDFGQFIIYSGRGYQLPQLTEDNLQWLVQNGYLQLGDIVQIDYNGDGKMEHTMIVTNININTGACGVTYHWETSGRENIEVADLMAEYSSANFYGNHLYNQF